MFENGKSNKDISNYQKTLPLNLHITMIIEIETHYATTIVNSTTKTPHPKKNPHTIISQK